MSYLFHPASLLLMLLWLGLGALKVWALVDCAARPASAFAVHGKLTKQYWLVILAVALICALLFPVLNVLSLAGTVAAIVYLVDVRPAVSGSANPWN